MFIGVYVTVISVFISKFKIHFAKEVSMFTFENQTSLPENNELAEMVMFGLFITCSDVKLPESLERLLNVTHKKLRRISFFCPAQAELATHGGTQIMYVPLRLKMFLFFQPL